MPSSVAPPTLGAYNASMALIDDIRAYEPFNEQEAVDRLAILRALANDPHVFDRSALAGASIIVSGGRIGYQIELAPEELIRLARADTADIICG